MDKSEKRDRGLMWKLSWAALFVIAVIAVYFLISVWYDVCIDGRSSAGIFDDGVYYFEAENNVYRWTESEGKRKDSGAGAETLENMKERDLRTAGAKYGFFTVEMQEGTEIPVYNLYWQKEQDSQRMLLLQSSDARTVVSDENYLMVHTDRYQEKRQGKTSCYQILYDEDEKSVTGLRLIDVIYTLKKK